MGAAVVMAMFASQELGPMATPVTTKDLVGKWQLVGSSTPFAKDQRRSTTIYQPDGSMLVHTTLGNGPLLVHTGKYVVGKGNIRHVLRGPDGRVSDIEVHICWAPGGRLRYSLNGFTWDLCERVKGL